MKRNLWALSRVVIVGIGVWGSFGGQAASNVDWTACVIVSLISPLALLGWLSAAKSHIDWSGPYSLTKPFVPMRTYPLRFWFLISLCLLSDGMALLGHDLASHGSFTVYGSLFFFWGASILLTLTAWIHFFRVGRLKKPS